MAVAGLDAAEGLRPSLRHAAPASLRHDAALHLQLLRSEVESWCGKG